MRPMDITQVGGRQVGTKVEVTYNIDIGVQRWCIGGFRVHQSMNLVKQCVANSGAVEHRSKRRCNSHCQQHLFSLSSLSRTTSKVSQATVLSFCPRIPRGTQPVESTYPEFNHDRLYFTDAFILGIDRKQLEANRNLQHTEHIRMASRTCQKNYRVYFPKPNDTHTLCAVCKINYGTHYYAHILSEYHKARIKECPYNKSIEELAQRFTALHPPNHAELSSPFKFPNHIIRQLQQEGADVNPLVQDPNHIIGQLQQEIADVNPLVQQNIQLAIPLGQPNQQLQVGLGLGQQPLLQRKSKKAKKSTKYVPKKQQPFPQKQPSLQQMTFLNQPTQAIVPENIYTLPTNKEESLLIEPPAYQPEKQYTLTVLSQNAQSARKKQCKQPQEQITAANKKTKRISRARKTDSYDKAQIQQIKLKANAQIGKKRGRKPKPGPIASPLRTPITTILSQKQGVFPLESLLQNQGQASSLVSAVSEQNKQEKMAQTLEEQSLDFLNQLRLDEHSQQKQLQYYDSKSLQVQQVPQQSKQNEKKLLKRQVDKNRRQEENLIDQTDKKIFLGQNTHFEKQKIQLPQVKQVALQLPQARQVAPLQLEGFILRDFLKKNIIQKLSQQREKSPKTTTNSLFQDFKYEQDAIVQHSLSKPKTIKPPIEVIDLVGQEQPQQFNQPQADSISQKNSQLQELSLELQKLQGKKNWKQLFEKYTEQHPSQKSASAKLLSSGSTLKRQRNDRIQQQKLSKKRITLFQPQAKAKLPAFENNSSDISSGTGSEGFQLEKFIFESKHKRANGQKKLLGSLEPVKAEAFWQLEKRVDKKSPQTWYTFAQRSSPKEEAQPKLRFGKL